MGLLYIFDYNLGLVVDILENSPNILKKLIYDSKTKNILQPFLKYCLKTGFMTLKQFLSVCLKSLFKLILLTIYVYFYLIIIYLIHKYQKSCLMLLKTKKKRNKNYLLKFISGFIYI